MRVCVYVCAVGIFSENVLGAIITGPPQAKKCAPQAKKIAEN